MFVMTLLSLKEPPEPKSTLNTTLFSGVDDFPKRKSSPLKFNVTIESKQTPSKSPSSQSKKKRQKP